MSHRLVPDGRVDGIRYIVYVPPEVNLGDRDQAAVARLIGRLNAKLATENYVLMGPGRWGSRSPGLGIPVGYGDIYHARAIIELVLNGDAPEPSYGTHFFQDLVEAEIYPLAVVIDDEFNQQFFADGPNALVRLLPDESRWEGVVRVIELPDDRVADLVMNGQAGRAIAYVRNTAIRSGSG